MMPGRTMYDINSEKVKAGNRCEKMVLDWLYSIGYFPKLYRTETGGAQIRNILGKTYIYPDIEVFIDSGFVDLKMLVEVKSHKEPVVQSHLYGYWINGGNLSDDKFGVAIRVETFFNYYRIWETIDYPVRVIFVVESTENWYWQSIEELYETKKYCRKMYPDGDAYFWYFSDLRTDFKGR